MKALVWHATNDVRVERVPDPKILNPRDAIVKITATAICGSDLHLLDGFIPTMQTGDILGHEFMGEVVEVGKENRQLQVGDRVVLPFTIACGRCFFCQAPARAHRAWGNRPVVRDHAPAVARRRAEGVSDLPRQAGSLHQGRDEAARGDRALGRSPSATENTVQKAFGVLRAFTVFSVVSPLCATSIVKAL